MSARSGYGRSMPRPLVAVLVAIVAIGTNLILAPAAHAEHDLITNGSFESPALGFGGVAITNAVPGWTRTAGSAGTGIEIQNNVAGSPAPGAGNQFVELDSNGSTGIFQNVATTTGDLCQLSFLFSPRPFSAGADNQALVTAGTSTLTVVGGVGGSNTNWLANSLPFTATGTSTQIQFLDIGPSNGSGLYIDLVVVRCGGDVPETHCTTTTIGGVIASNLTFVTGTHCYRNTFISGSIVIGSGGALSLFNSYVSGNVTVSGATAMTVCASTLGGNVTVANATGLVLIGDGGDGQLAPNNCPGNVIIGSVILVSNKGGIELGGTTVVKSVTLGANIGTPHKPTELENNNIVGSLSCGGNVPAPTNDGRPNTAASKSGQTCVGGF